MIFYGLYFLKSKKIINSIYLSIIIDFFFIDAYTIIWSSIQSASTKYALMTHIFFNSIVQLSQGIRHPLHSSFSAMSHSYITIFNECILMHPRTLSLGTNHRLMCVSLSSLYFIIMPYCNKALHNFLRACGCVHVFFKRTHRQPTNKHFYNLTHTKIYTPEAMWSLVIVWQVLLCIYMVYLKSTGWLGGNRNRIFIHTTELSDWFRWVCILRFDMGDTGELVIVWIGLHGYCGDTWDFCLTWER